MNPTTYQPDTHYPILKEWWNAHNFPAPPQECLSNRGTIITDPSHTPLAAAWLYTDPSTCLAMMEFIITNPANTPLTSMRAIHTLTNHISSIATSLGKTHLFTTVPTASLSRLLQACDFTQTDTNYIHLIRPLLT